MIRSSLTFLAILAFGVSAQTSTARAAENEVVLNIEPSKENPRNSEGSFVRLKSGRVLFYYSQFYGGSADESPARIAGIHSEDGGRTWSQPEVVLENSAGNNVMSVSLLRLASGKLAFFYVLKNSWLDCRPYVRFSTDESATWSEPKLIKYAYAFEQLTMGRVTPQFLPTFPKKA